MDISVFGAVNAPGVMAQDLHKASEADSGKAEFTGALSECMNSDGSAGQVDASKDSLDGAGGAKDAPGRSKSFHNLRKKSDDDIGRNEGMDHQTPLQDTEPPQGATEVKNADQPASVDRTLSDSGLPGGSTDAQGADKDARNTQNTGLLYTLPLYQDTGTLKAVSSVSSGSGGSVGSGDVVSKDVVTGFFHSGFFHSGAAKGLAADASGGNAVGVNSKNGVSACAGQGSENNADGQGDGNGVGGPDPQAVKGLSLKPVRHDMTTAGLLKDPGGTGADPSGVAVDKSAETVAAAAAQGGSSDAGGSGSTDDGGFEGKGNSNIHSVKEASAGNAAFTVDNLAEKTSFEGSKNIDTQAHDTTANNDVYDKLNSGINIALTRGAKEVTISLHPDHLGAIHIKLNMGDSSENAVSARITVDSIDVKGILDADAGAIKEAFSRQGLKLDGYTVELNKNALGADGGGGSYSYGGNGGAGGFRDGPSYQGAGGWADQGGEMKDNGQNGSRFQGAGYGAGGNSGVDLFA